MMSTPSTGPSANPDSPGWKHAAAELISARVELFRLELKQFREESGRKAVAMATASVAAACAWLLLLAGTIPLVADSTGLPWPVIALCAAGFHVIVAIVFLSLALRKTPPPFTATMAEFQKDREWLNQLPTPKS